MKVATKQFMRQCMKSILYQKQPGVAGVFDFVPLVLTIILCGYITIFFGGYLKFLNQVTLLENVTKKYILIMETENGMSQTCMTNLCEEIKSIGVASEDIDLTGTTFQSEGKKYGEEIVLKINVLIPYHTMAVRSDWSRDLTTQKKKVEMMQCTLALGSS